ncbi:MAG TPA: copper chaperone [Armatimonadetes bacterium]|nr:copper chaperone [Armatimonadota bacterium]
MKGGKGAVPWRVESPGAVSLLEAARGLARRAFGSRVFLSPRLPPRVKKGSEREAFEGGLVCGVGRGNMTVAGLWVGRHDGDFCGVAISTQGIVLGLYVRVGRTWVERGTGLKGRKLGEVAEALRKAALPRGLKVAFLRGVGLLVEVLGPGFALLPERRLCLSPFGLRAFLLTRPLLAREDMPFEAEVLPEAGATLDFSLEVRAMGGRAAEPELLCLTPWGSLLWRGKLKPGRWAVEVSRPEGRRFSYPFWVFPTPVREAVLIVKGMGNALDAHRVRRALESLPGVRRVEVDIESGRVKVVALSGAVLDREKLRERLEELGYKVERVEPLTNGPGGT